MTSTNVKTHSPAAVPCKYISKPSLKLLTFICSFRNPRQFFGNCYVYKSVHPYGKCFLFSSSKPKRAGKIKLHVSNRGGMLTPGSKSRKVLSDQGKKQSCHLTGVYIHMCMPWVIWLLTHLRAQRLCLTVSFFLCLRPEFTKKSLLGN